MGYYTKFELEIQGDMDRWVKGTDRKGNTVEVNLGLDTSSILQEIKDLSGYHDTFEEEVKWYDHETHMREISRRYPTALFILTGKGEEPGDLWRAYFQNGLCQREEAVIVYGSFDPSRLK